MTDSHAANVPDCERVYDAEEIMSPREEQLAAEESSSVYLSPFRTLSPRHRRILAVLIPLAVVAIVYAVEFNRRHQEVQRLVNEISNAGGVAWPKASQLDRLTAQWHNFRTGTGNYRVFEQTFVVLSGNNFNGEWLRAHDDLAALDIDLLSVDESPLSASDVVRLVKEHPLKHLYVRNVPNSDAIAEALRAKQSVRSVSISDSDLTDSGLRMLPLENLASIDVDGTAVTPDGLLELRRSGELKFVGLDGGQFDDSVADLLGGQEIDLLSLYGSDVTDEHLRRIEGMTVRHLWLWNSSVTSKGVAALEQALPNCRIRLHEDSETESEESVSD